MWRTLAFGTANLLLSLSSYLVRIPGLELTPAALVILAQGGESILIGSLVLGLTYMIPQPKRFAYVWLHIPTAALAGWLAIVTDNLYVPILVYEGLSALAGVLLGVMNGSYIVFLVVNTLLNLLVVRVYGMM